jgi:uncharacterized protein (TIGR02996 family)
MGRRGVAGEGVPEVTDDEAFIRAIVDSPGDDTPRLVYADWLDDRDDPGAKYVRIEAEAIRRWNETRDMPTLMGGIARMGDAGASLDPVWVARMSRPPFGVCCDHVRFLESRRETRPRITTAELDWIEERFHLTLPTDYRAFLLNYNGGCPDPAHFRFPGREYNEGHHEQVVNFPAVWSAAEPEIDADDDLVYRLVHLDDYRSYEIRWEGEVHRNLMIAGFLAPGDLDWICVGCRGDIVGQVYAMAAWLPDDSQEEIVHVAPSFAMFLSTLMDHDLPHIQAVKKGDVAALRRWLDAGGDVNALFRGAYLVTYAVWYSQPAVLRELLARGATVYDGLLADAESRKNPEVIRLLRAKSRVAESPGARNNE